MNRNKKYENELCYCCQKKCDCKRSSTTTTPTRSVKKVNTDFIKSRNNKGILKPPAERIPWSGPSSSRSTSKCSNAIQLLQNFENDSKNPSSINLNSESSTSTGSNYTYRRELYEKGRENNDPIQKLMYASGEVDAISTESISALNEFRLNNADSCLSFMSKYSLRDKLIKMDSEEKTALFGHTCEYPMHINARGLLETTTDMNGFAFCSICNKSSKSSNEKSFVPIVTLSSQQNISSSSSLPKQTQICHHSKLFASQDQCQQIIDSIIPANSLALRYQKH